MTANTRRAPGLSKSNERKLAQAHKLLRQVGASLEAAGRKVDSDLVIDVARAADKTHEALARLSRLANTRRFAVNFYARVGDNPNLLVASYSTEGEGLAYDVVHRFAEIYRQRAAQGLEVPGGLTPSERTALATARLEIKQY